MHQGVAADALWGQTPASIYKTDSSSMHTEPVCLSVYVHRYLHMEHINSFGEGIRVGPPVFGMLKHTLFSAGGFGLGCLLGLGWYCSMTLNNPLKQTLLHMHEESSRRAQASLALKYRYIYWVDRDSYCPVDNSVTSCSQGMACASAVT